jgi:hypothetical protein
MDTPFPNHAVRGSAEIEWESMKVKKLTPSRTKSAVPSLLSRYLTRGFVPTPNLGWI